MKRTPYTKEKGGLRASGAVDSVEEKGPELLNLRKDVTECLDSYRQAQEGSPEC